ncbi:hypothetical protein HK096_010042 [Nowakowskiella sp. JEL0078]|nr:hypothetical protein HK096_010042 [Nowakowskiella sp. JEL0078]
MSSNRYELELVLPKDSNITATFGPRPGVVSAPPENKTKIWKWVKATNKQPVDFWADDEILKATWSAFQLQRNSEDVQMNESEK